MRNRLLLFLRDSGLAGVGDAVWFLPFCCHLPRIHTPSRFHHHPSPMPSISLFPRLSLPPSFCWDDQPNTFRNRQPVRPKAKTFTHRNTATFILVATFQIVSALLRRLTFTERFSREMLRLVVIRAETYGRKNEHYRIDMLTNTFTYK